MKILFFGDVYGKPGRQALAKVLPRLRKQLQPDFILTNVENLAHGRGPSEKQLHELVELGVDGFTSGNHIFDSAGGIALAESKKFPLVRPANYPTEVPGKTHFVLKKGRQKLFITNLLGRVFMGDPTDNPFSVADEILKEAQKLKVKNIFVDFHAEATSEKAMFGAHLDGKVSAVVGTHTHVQTADERILPGGTAYISDVGMCGVLNSIIGAKVEIARKRFLHNLPVKLEVAEGAPFIISGVLVELKKDGKAKSIERVYEVED
ncbi:MAG: TIGR00282 family metallophosphoesterase [Patescibacteria group bacterium]